MTSISRKQAWLAELLPPLPDRELNGWAYIWRIHRQRNVRHEYCLCLIQEDRTFRVYIRRESHPLGLELPRADHLLPLLKSLLSPGQLAVAMAATLTRNHANTGD